jgi:hypothetical protein
MHPPLAYTCYVFLSSPPGPHHLLRAPARHHAHAPAQRKAAAQGRFCCFLHVISPRSGGSTASACSSRYCVGCLLSCYHAHVAVQRKAAVVLCLYLFVYHARACNSNAKRMASKSALLFVLLTTICIPHHPSLIPFSPRSLDAAHLPRGHLLPWPVPGRGPRGEPTGLCTYRCCTVKGLTYPSAACA